MSFRFKLLKHNNTYILAYITANNIFKYRLLVNSMPVDSELEYFQTLLDSNTITLNTEYDFHELYSKIIDSKTHLNLLKCNLSNITTDIVQRIYNLLFCNVIFNDTLFCNISEKFINNLCNGKTYAFYTTNDYLEVTKINNKYISSRI